MKRIQIFLLFLAVLAAPPALRAQAFTHPGCLSTAADLNRMAAMVQTGAHPWIDSWNILINNSAAQTNYTPNPQGTITRNASGGNYPILMYDIAAAYQCALRYNISGDTNYANTSIKIMNAWSGTLTNLTGDPNATLLNIYGYEFACAGELMRNYSGWNPTNFAAFTNMMYTLWVPGAIGFWTGHDGQCDTYMWANWDLLCMDSVLAIGVLCDNTNIYNQAINHFKSGFGNGNIEQTVYHVFPGYLGQGQEEGRDQGHSGLEVSLLGVFCTIAYNQGTDLFAYENNRVLSLCEYFAKYNLGNDVPYVTYEDCNGDYQPGVSPASRGDIRPAWDLIYNHYVNLKGVAAPWSAQYAALVRPEGGGGNYGGNSGGYDQLGFTTLTASLPPIGADTPPSGLTAALSGTNVVLSWWGAPYATNYNFKRATISDGPYTTIGNVTTNLLTFTDSNVVSGTTYYYTVSALSSAGESANSAQAQASVQPVPLAYLKFDENTGTNAFDATGNGWTGTLMNGATWTTGHSNSAVNLNGTSNYVSVATNITAGLNDFTIAAWVYLNSVTTWMRIFDFGVGDYAPIPTPTRYMFLSPQAGSGVVRFAITSGGPGAEEQINGTAPLPTGGWHHVAVTLSGTVGVLYVDGVAVASTNGIYFTPAGLGTTTQNCIGRSQFAADPYLNGKVDDFRIYNGALSATQIAALVAGYGVAPAAPTNVTATAVSASQINLAWNPVNNATNYDVLRSTTNNGPYTILATGITATNYSDTALAGGTTYYYVLTALNNAGAGTNSTQASATTLTPPNAPASLTATGVFSGQVYLSWTASAGATSYNVQSSYVSGGPYVTIATGVTTTGYTNSGLTGDVTYYYVVSAVNANGVSANSTEANATPPVPLLTWQGAVNTNWDINVTTNWISGGAPAVYLDGDAPLFNDSTAANLVNLAANVSPSSITFSNTTQNYIFNSAGGYGIGGAASLIKWGTGTATLNTTNTFSGGITINYGTLAVGGAGNLGGGNYAGNIADYGTFVCGSTAAQTLSGVISGPGGLTKNGTNTLTLSGVNTYSGATTVNAGTLALTGNGSLAPDNEASTLLIGNTSGASAAFWQTNAGSAVSVTASALGALQIGSTPGASGYYNLAGGRLTLAGEMDIGGSSGGAGTFGQFDLSGGSVILPNSSGAYVLPNRGAAGECSVVNISGGTVGISGGGLPTDGGANGLAVNWSSSGAAQTNVTTITSNAVFSTPSFGAYLNVGGNSANVATLNLNNGGTLVVDQIAPAAGASTVNFNGGTLIEGSTSGVLFGANAVQTANIYSNGMTVNDNGYAVAIGQNLTAPVGNGVASIPVATGGAGYLMPPQVIIAGGSGSNATAYAAISGGTVTGITVTCPGEGYATAPAVTLVGGGYTTAATHGTVTLAANVSGGFTKTGSGTVALSGVNTYTGTTVISNGTLQLNGPVLHFSFDNVTGGTNIINDGSGGSAMNGVLTGTNVVIVSGGRFGNALMVSNGPASNGYVLVGSPVVNFNGQAGNNWTMALWLKTSTAGAVYLYQGSGGWASGNTEFYLENGTQGDGAGTHQGGVRWGQNWVSGTTNLNDGNWHFVVMSVTNGTKTLYCDGAVDPVLSGSSSWAGAGTGNQLWIGGAASGADSQVGFNGLIDEVSIYSRALSQTEMTSLMNRTIVTSQALPVASTVTVTPGATLDLNGFNAAIAGLNGAGTVDTTSTNFAPTLTISNNVNAAFSGVIQNSGNLLSLVKTGSGTQTLNGPDTYGGNTMISAGTLQLTNIPPTTNATFTFTAPLLYLSFNDVSGSTVINQGSGGSALNGTLTGTATIVAGGINGGNALSIPAGAANAAYVLITNPVVSMSGSASWTIGMWVKTITAGGVYAYQGSGGWASGNMTFYLNEGSDNGYGTKAGGVSYAQGWEEGSTTINDGNWHFLVMTCNGSTKSIYVDSNVDTIQSSWASATGVGSQLWIGGSADTTDKDVGLAGLIDDVYVYNYALTQTQIQTLYNYNPARTAVLPPTTAVSVAAGATLDVGGVAQTIGSLTGPTGSSVILADVTNATGIFTVGNASNTVFAGTISGTGSLTKVGSGTLTLSGANTYVGATVVSNGTLAVNNTTGSATGAGNVTVQNGGSLGGNGAVSGTVAINPGGEFTPGNPLGALTIGGNLTLVSGSTTLVQVQHAPLTNSAVKVSGTLAYGGTLTVTNIASPLAAGDIFQLFSAGTYQGAYAATNLPALNYGLGWQFKATNGVLSVLQIVATNSPNVTATFSNHNLTLSWPSDHTGWALQIQTNPLASGLGTNWLTVPNSTNADQFSTFINPATGGVFFRLVFP